MKKKLTHLEVIKSLSSTIRTLKKSVTSMTQAMKVLSEKVEHLESSSNFSAADIHRSNYALSKQLIKTQNFLVLSGRCGDVKRLPLPPGAKLPEISEGWEVFS